MPTYLYETIPTSANEEPKHYEIKQSMHDQPLTHHPETGEPLRRVILGGYGLPPKPSSGGHCCSGSDCC